MSLQVVNCSLSFYIEPIHVTLSRSLVNLVEVFLRRVNFRLDGVGTGLPVSGAHFTVLVGELESFQQSERFVDGSTDGQVVDGDLSQGALGVDQEDTSEGNAFFFDQHTVVLRQRVVGVGDQGDVDGAQATVLSGDVGPGQQRVFRVGRGEQHLAVLFGELLGGLRVGNDFGGAHEGEGQGDEGQQHPLTLVVFQRNGFEGTVDDGGLGEGRSGLLNLSNHYSIDVEKFGGRASAIYTEKKVAAPTMLNDKLFPRSRNVVLTN